MKIIAFFTKSLGKLYRWYREPISGHQLIRVDPITALTILALAGLATSFWGMGRGMGTEAVSVDLANTLRNAPVDLENNINNAYESNQISGYEREVALQQVAELSEIYLEMADTIENKGQEASFNAAAQALIETIMSYGPGGKTGSLIGASSTGKGLDQIFSILSLTNSIENFEVFSTPFSEEENILRDRIQQVMGMDTDALFLARVRTQINLIRRWYLDALRQQPCSGEEALATYRAGLIKTEWGKNIPVYGEGEKWPSYEAFLDWMIAEARGEGGEHLTQTWQGDFDLSSTPRDPCSAVCVPPTMSGTILLQVNLETCEVSGKISGTGEGNATTTLCDNNGKTINAYGTASFSGTVQGMVDSAGNLNFEITTITGESFVEMSESPSGLTHSSTNPINEQVKLTGTLKWNGPANGSLQFSGTPCAVSGEWHLKLE